MGAKIKRLADALRVWVNTITDSRERVWYPGKIGWVHYMDGKPSNVYHVILDGSGIGMPRKRSDIHTEDEHAIWLLMT